MIFNRLLGLFSHDLAIDLGTATTLVYVKGEGIICSEPSAVAVHRDTRGTKKVLAVGIRGEADDRPHAGEHRGDPPIKDGVIADFEVTEAMLRYFIRKAHKARTLVRPRIIICVPYGCTEVERRAVRESAQSAGARECISSRSRWRRRSGLGSHHRTVRQHDRRHRGRHDRGGGHLPRGIVKSQSVRVPATRWTRRSSST